jgi:thioredoxin 1
MSGGIIEKQIITGFGDRHIFFETLKINPGIIVVFFHADWCGPCKKIAPIVENFFATSPNNVLCADIDADESFDLYAFLKHQKMINGIPVILMYKKGNISYIPDDSVTGSDLVQLDSFFKRCVYNLQNIEKEELNV